MVEQMKSKSEVYAQEDDGQKAEEEEEEKRGRTRWTSTRGRGFARCHRPRFRGGRPGRVEMVARGDPTVETVGQSYATV